MQLNAKNDFNLDTRRKKYTMLNEAFFHESLDH